jgi:hypothetical protein
MPLGFQVLGMSPYTLKRSVYRAQLWGCAPKKRIFPIYPPYNDERYTGPPMSVYGLILQGAFPSRQAKMCLVSLILFDYSHCLTD